LNSLPIYEKEIVGNVHFTSREAISSFFLPPKLPARVNHANLSAQVVPANFDLVENLSQLQVLLVKAVQ
jgi:hypothetical protein